MDNEKFADSGEFQGMGAAKEKEEPSANADTPPADKPDETGEAGAGKSASGETADNSPEPADKQPEGNVNEKPDAEKPDAEKAEEKKEEPEADPLDAIITDFSKVDLGLGDAPVDKVILEAFGKQCEALKLSQRQAAELVKFQLSTIADAQKKLVEESVAELSREWGKNAQDNQHRVNNLIDKVDASMDGKFRRAIEASGADCYSDFVRGLLSIAAMLGEDSLGPVNQTAPQKEETALEGLQAVFAQARK